MDIVEALQGMEMNRTTKGILMNASVLAALGFFYFNGTPLLVLLISGAICLAVINVVLVASKPRR
jgi:hypothetical protein